MGVVHLVGPRGAVRCTEWPPVTHRRRSQEKVEGLVDALGCAPGDVDSAAVATADRMERTPVAAGLRQVHDEPFAVPQEQAARLDGESAQVVLGRRALVPGAQVKRVAPTRGVRLDERGRLEVGQHLSGSPQVEGAGLLFRGRAAVERARAVDEGLHRRDSRSAQDEHQRRRGRIDPEVVPHLLDLARQHRRRRTRSTRWWRRKVFPTCRRPSTTTRRGSPAIAASAWPSRASSSVERSTRPGNAMGPSHMHYMADALHESCSA